jgi:type VI secretion system protein ImpJ
MTGRLTMAWRDKVVWSEGMFLRPVHFQQHVRYVESLVESRCSALRSHSWGFTSLELDTTLLRLGKVAIARASGVLPDGTPFDIPEGDRAPEPLDIARGALGGALVCLSLPVRRRGTPELLLPGEDRVARYVLDEIDVADAHTRGQASAPVQVGRLDLKLTLDDGHAGDFTRLGIARLVECRDDGTVVLDDAYLAPVLDCRALPALHGHIRELQGLLAQRAEALAARVSAAGRGGMSEIADFLLLQLVNRAAAQAAHLAGHGSVHPETLYAFALELAAELATYTRPDKRPPAFPAYRHTDLQQAFHPLMMELRRSLGMVLEQSAIALPLEERKYGMRVATIADRSLLHDASFVIAARARMPGDELRRRLPAQAKVGAVEQIRELVNLQLPGVALSALPVAPRQLPYHAGSAYFELERSGEAWTALSRSAALALHVSGEFPGLELELWAVRH